MTSIKAIRELFESFRGKHILVIGDVMVDAYLWGSVDRISPEAPVPVVALRKREYRLGGAANVALNIRNLGGIPVLCSVAGTDDKAALFRDLLNEAGLSGEGIVNSDVRITTVKFRIIGNNAQMLRVDEETEEALNKTDTGALIGRIREMIGRERVDAIVFEDYDKGVISPVLIDEVTSLAERNGIPVAVDPKKKHFLDYHNVSLFKPNLKELREGLKLDGDLKGDSQLLMAAALLQERMGMKTVMITLSERGILYRHILADGRYEENILPAHVRNIADVSGAGDTVISTAAMCLAAGADAALMAALCNLAGGLVCEHPGVVPVDRDLLIAEAIERLCLPSHEERL